MSEISLDNDEGKALRDLRAARASQLAPSEASSPIRPAHANIASKINGEIDERLCFHCCSK